MVILYEENGELNAVVFDATLRYTPTASAMVTEHPVEGGADITDHTRIEADRLSADCFVSTKPVYSPNFDGADGSIQSVELEGAERSLTRGANVGNGSVKPATYESKTQRATARVLQFSEPFDRLGDVHATLKRLLANAIECTIDTGTLGVWDRMALTSVSAPKEAQGSVTFTIEAKQLRFVDSETVEVEPLETRAERELRLGSRGTEEAESEEDISLAAQLLEAATGSGLVVSPRRSGVGIFTR